MSELAEKIGEAIVDALDGYESDYETKVEELDEKIDDFKSSLEDLGDEVNEDHKRIDLLEEGQRRLREEIRKMKEQYKET